MPRTVVSRPELAAQMDAIEKEFLEKARKKGRSGSRKAKAAESVRKRLHWGVFSASGKRVAVFEVDKKKDAEKRATELSKNGKNIHFTMKVKEPIVEE